MTPLFWANFRLGARISNNPAAAFDPPKTGYLILQTSCAYRIIMSASKTYNEERTKWRSECRKLLSDHIRMPFFYILIAIIDVVQR